MSFFVILSLISVPYSADASLLSTISKISNLLGTASADETSKESAVNADSNSQNMDLSIITGSESSVNPDLKTVSSDKDLNIENNSFLYTGGTEDAYVPDASFERSSLSNQIIVYTVKEGDTMSEIAEEFGISTNTIRWENNISGNTISVGKKLNILPVTGVKHIVKNGDTISSIAKKYDADTNDIVVFNGLSEKEGLKKGDIIFVPNGVISQPTSSSTSSSSKKGSSSVSSSSGNIRVAPSGYYLRPTSGRITSPYGPRKGSYHYGVDFGEAEGTAVFAAASGVITQVVSSCREGATSCGGRYGNYIIIQHANGQSTRYAHLQSVKVSVGQEVSQGQKIAASGNTGYSTGPHLHFEVINSNGTTVRPPFSR